MDSAQTSTVSGNEIGGTESYAIPLLALANRLQLGWIKNFFDKRSLMRYAGASFWP